MATTDISNRQYEIIEAAGKLLTSSGVMGLTTKGMAKEMNFSEAAIYRHFSSKEAIILAMLEYLATNMDERLSAVPASLPPDERLRGMFREQFRFFKKNPHFAVAIFSDGLLAESGRINDAIARIMDVKVRHLGPLLREGQLAGVFTDAIPVDHMMHIVMGTFRLLMFKWRVSNFQTDIKRKGDSMIDSILTLIKK